MLFLAIKTLQITCAGNFFDAVSSLLQEFISSDEVYFAFFKLWQIRNRSLLRFCTTKDPRAHLIFAVYKETAHYTLICGALASGVNHIVCI